jgi:hypothetical protein
MPRYKIEDSQTGKTMIIEGDSPPSEQESMKLFNQALQGSVEKTQPVNDFMDTLRGFGSGLTTLQRAAAELPMRFSNEYLRPLIGKEKLDEQGMEQARSYLGKYEPETGAGKVANFVGSTISYLAIPMGGTIKGASAIGSGIGAAESLSRGDDFSDVAANTAFGGIAGAGGQQALKGLGFAFEKTMPLLGRLASIKESNMKRAIERIQEGGSIFGKDENEVNAMVNEALETMRNSGNLSREEIDNITNGIISKYSKGTPVNPQASAVKSNLKELENDINLSTEYGAVKPSISNAKPQDDLFYDNIRSNVYNQVDAENAMLPEETKQMLVDSMIEKMGIRSNKVAPQLFNDGEINPVALHQIKSKIQHDVEFNKENRAYNKQGEALLREIQGSFGNVLKEKYPEYSPAMKEYADLMASKDFDKLLKTGNIYEIGRALTPIIGGLTGLGLTGNPLFTGLSLLSSPKAQRYLLEAYGTGSRNITPKIPQVGITATEKLIPKRTDEYGK